MPRTKRELTPRPQNRCWRKFYKGKYHYVGRGATKPDGSSPWDSPTYKGTNTDCPAYKQALAEWRLLKAKIDAEESPSPSSALALNHAFNLLQFGGIPQGGEQPLSAFTPEQIQALRQLLESQTVPESGSADPVVSMATNYAGEPPLDETGVVCPGDTSVDGLVKAFLAEKESLTHAGEIKPRMMAEYKAKIEDFQGFCKKHQRTDINQVDTALLSGYRQTQLRLTTLDKKAGGISKFTAKKRLRTVKVFMEWAYVIEALDRLPRIVLKDFDKITLPAPKPEFYTVKQVQELYKAAPPLLQASILLAANCGYYQNDVASLTWEMIDRKTGIVSRERGKTGVPMQHRLWPITLAMLKKLSKSKTGLVLKRDDGKPLFQEEIGADGKCKIKDAIASMFRSVQRSLGQTINGKGFSTLRNTSANLIEQHYKAKPWVSEQFLGHSTHGMKKHYVAANFDDCLEACDWLATQFKFDKLKAVASEKPSV